jgi:hypothetical protein
MSKWNNGRLIGDSKLKKFTRGGLADQKPITKLDKIIYLLFVKGYSLGKIQRELSKRNIQLEEQQMYDIIRKVGLEYQTLYRKEINVPFDRPKIIFAEFVKGIGIQTLSDDYQINPHDLFAILRKIGLLYAQYLKIY